LPGRDHGLPLALVEDRCENREVNGAIGFYGQPGVGRDPVGLLDQILRLGHRVGKLDQFVAEGLEIVQLRRGLFGRRGEAVIGRPGGRSLPLALQRPAYPRLHVALHIGQAVAERSQLPGRLRQGIRVGLANLRQIHHSTKTRATAPHQSIGNELYTDLGPDRHDHVPRRFQVCRMKWLNFCKIRSKVEQEFD
jgi:hypothetical protein